MGLHYSAIWPVDENGIRKVVLPVSAPPDMGALHSPDSRESAFRMLHHGRKKQTNKKNHVWVSISINCNQTAVKPNDSFMEGSVAGCCRTNDDVVQRELRAVGVSTSFSNTCNTCFLLFKFLAGYTLT